MGSLLAFTLSLLIARTYGVDGSGQFYYYLTIYSFLVLILSLGLRPILVREVARANRQDRIAIFSKLTTRNFVLCSAGVVLAYLIEVVVAKNLSINLFVDATVFLCIAWIMMGLLVSFINGLGKSPLANVIETSLLPLITIAYILFYPNPEWTDALTAYLGASTLGMIFCLVYLRKYFSNEIQYDAKGKLPFISASILLVDLSNYGAVWFPVVLLGMVSTPEAVGLYNISLRIALLANFVVLASNTVLTPKLVEELSGKDYSGTKKLCNKFTFTILLICSPFFTTVLVFPEWTLSFFGTEFVEAKNFLIIATVGRVVMIAIGPVGNVLIAHGRESLYARVNLVSVLLTSAMSAFILIFYDPLYMVISYTVCGILSRILLSYLVYRITSMLLYPHISMSDVSSTLKIFKSILFRGKIKSSQNDKNP